MAILTQATLDDLGIHLDDPTYTALAEHFEETLDKRVIEEIVNELTPEQADDFANLQDPDDKQIYDWLTSNVQNLSEIISDEVDILLGELAESADKL